MAKKRSLKSVLQSSPACYKKFQEAEACALNIFKTNECLPFYTTHGEDHCKMLENYLDQMIWREGRAKQKDDFIPSPEEAAYLLSAVYTHDLGMWHGILSEDKPGNLKDAEYVINLRERHELRSADYINNVWKTKEWSGQERHHLANICVFHRKSRLIKDFVPYKIKGKYTKEVRLNVLAALLRLADACHIDQSRAPERVMNLYISLGMPKEAAIHWERAKLIQEVSFDAQNIKVTGRYPEPMPFGFGNFDLCEVGGMLCNDLTEELHSVQQTLMGFANIGFLDVKHDSQKMLGLQPQQKEQCLSMWPYLLSKPFSATELAAALAYMLQIAIDYSEETKKSISLFKNDIEEIMQKVIKWRPGDFMLRNLSKNVTDIIDSEKAYIDKLKEYLSQFIAKLESNCETMASLAQSKIKSGDAIIIYGYSTNVERLLKRIGKKHSVYVVECPKEEDVYLQLNENEQIIQLVSDIGFSNVYYLQLTSLARILEKVNKKKCKLILGTHGILKSGNLMCKAGTYTLVATAKKFNLKVIAFAEKMKLLENGMRDSAVAGPGKLSSAKKWKHLADVKEIVYVSSKMDTVRKSWVNLIINEKRAVTVAV